MGPSAIFGISTAATLLAFYYVMWWRAGPHIERARELVSKGAALIDVDEPQEFELEHIEGATNIPLGDLARRAHELGPFEHPIVVSGRDKVRTVRAARELRLIGFHQVLNVGQAHW